jgi:hypothetical protein
MNGMLLRMIFMIHASDTYEKDKRTSTMPKDWEPRMYLGALNPYIMNNAILSLESVALDRRSYATTNELH